MRVVLSIIAAVAVGMAAATLSSPVQAALIVTVETVTAAPGDTGLLEVVISSDIEQRLSGFSVELALGGSQAQFTNVDSATTDPYVFGAESFGILADPGFPNTGFYFSDISANLDGFVTLNAGETYGLGRVAFAIDSNAAAGFRPITFVLGATTQFDDDLVNPIAGITFVSGGIDVDATVAQAVPEPATLGLFLVGGSCALLLGAVRRGKAVLGMKSFS